LVERGEDLGRLLRVQRDKLLGHRWRDRHHWRLRWRWSRRRGRWSRLGRDRATDRRRGRCGRWRRYRGRYIAICCRHIGKRRARRLSIGARASGFRAECTCQCIAESGGTIGRETMLFELLLKHHLLHSAALPGLIGVDRAGRVELLNAEGIGH
jgi:hypothetical protein